MNKIKSFPWPALLLMFPLFAIIFVSNGSVETEVKSLVYTWTSPYGKVYTMDEQCSRIPIWLNPIMQGSAYINHLPECAKSPVEINKIQKENKMNENAIVAISWVSVISVLVLCVYAYFRRRHIDDHKYAQAKDEREFNLKVKEIELNQTIRLQEAELERYKTLELSKTQMDNEHEVALKKLEFDKSIDARDFMITVTKDEREYLLKQRELDIKEGKSSPSFMDVIDSNKDVQLRLKK